MGVMPDQAGLSRLEQSPIRSAFAGQWGYPFRDSGSMRQVFFQLFWGAVAVIGAAAVVVWVRQGVSDQELLANFAKGFLAWGVE